MSEPKTSKMILAVLQGDDYNSVVNALNQAGFFVTLLHSSGGFLKRRSVTVMIGVDATRLDEAPGSAKKKYTKVTIFPAAASSRSIPP